MAVKHTIIQQQFFPAVRNRKLSLRGKPYFSDHIRSLTERFDSKLADVGNPLVEQLGKRPRGSAIHFLGYHD
jgi:hypothetical protein